jgi:hypothetical protein
VRDDIAPLRIVSTDFLNVETAHVLTGIRPDHKSPFLVDNVCCASTWGGAGSSGEAIDKVDILKLSSAIITYNGY